MMGEERLLQSHDVLAPHVRHKGGLKSFRLPVFLQEF